MNHSRLLQQFGACGPVRDWYDGRDSEQAWAECPRGDWMLWTAEKLGVDRHRVVLAACDCAERALVHIPAGEDRPRQAIERARAWTRGEASLDDVRRAADAAFAYADAAYATYVGAAYAAAYAATAAYADAAYAAAHAAAAAVASDATYAVTTYGAAYAAARAIYAAATAAAYARNAAAEDADAAREQSLAESAQLVRARIPWRVIAEKIAANDG